MVKPDYDCQACGACCISNWDTETYVGMLDSDVKRLLRVAGESTVDQMVGHRGDQWEQGMLTKENEQGHITCVALEGRVGECVSCSIYDGRPKACRDFKAGSDICRLARQEAGLD